MPDNWSSRFLLSIGKLAPRGGWRVVKFAAQRAPNLQIMKTKIASLSIPIFLDLRDPSCIQYYLTGDAGGNRKIRKVLPQVIRAGDVYFDIGANYGIVAAAVLPMIGDHGRMVLAEANPSVAQNLGLTFHNIKNVTVCASAISETEGEVKFYVSESSACSTLSDNWDYEKVLVPSTQIDSLIMRHGVPDILKVDVEGAEATVLRSARSLLGSASCPIIFFEALSDRKLAESMELIRDLHQGEGQFYHIADGGKLVFLDHPKASSDYVYVPDRFSERVISLISER
jgi:FkbM family methyltransferase